MLEVESRPWAMRGDACLRMLDGGWTYRKGRAGWAEKALWMAAIVVLFPEAAFAFGPATHIDLGLQVLRYGALLPLALRGLVRRYPEYFLYGGCSADIVIGKNLAKYVHNCHNWQVGFKMLDHASNDRMRALSWGFLAHLAADVVAHNYFVPLKVVESYKGRMTRHAYWELRFDQAMHGSDGVWQTLVHIGRSRFPEADRFLREELSRASRLFPFDVSRRIFNSLMFVGRAERWRTMNLNVAERSVWQFSPGELERCNRAAFDAVLALLIDGPGSRPVKVDPTGKPVLVQARRMRRGLKRLAKRGQIADRLTPGAQELLSSRLRDGMYASVSVPSLGELLGGDGGTGRR